MPACSPCFTSTALPLSQPPCKASLIDVDTDASNYAEHSRAELTTVPSSHCQSLDDTIISNWMCVWLKQYPCALGAPSVCVQPHTSGWRCVWLNQVQSPWTAGILQTRFARQLQKQQKSSCPEVGSASHYWPTAAIFHTLAKSVS